MDSDWGSRRGFGKMLAPAARADKQYFWVAVVIAVLFACWGAANVSATGPVAKDSLQNLTAAYSIAHQFEFDEQNDEGKWVATSFREPLPPLMLAVVLRVSGLVTSETRVEQLNEPANIRIMKRFNYLWVAVGLVGVYLLATAGMSGIPYSWGVALLAEVLVAWLCHEYFDPTNLLTEIHASAILTFATWAFVRAIQSERLRWAFTAGVLLGLLVLTKAVFLYVIFLFVLPVMLLAEVIKRASGFASFFRIICVVGFSVALTVLPWMLRNYSTVGSMEVAKRGPSVLYVRAVEDGMTSQERGGAIYAFSPYKVRRFLGPVMGYTPQDLLAGGRLQRLNRNANRANDDVARNQKHPDAAVSYFFRAVTQYEMMSEAETETRAWGFIEERLGAHIILTPIFLWRGMWGDMLPWTVLLTIPLLFGAFAYGAVVPNQVLLALTAPSVGALAFYAALTHFVPRYSVPIEPILIVVACVVGARAVYGITTGETILASRRSLAKSIS